MALRRFTQPASERDSERLSRLSAGQCLAQHMAPVRDSAYSGSADGALAHGDAPEGAAHAAVPWSYWSAPPTRQPAA